MKVLIFVVCLIGLSSTTPSPVLYSPYGYQVSAIGPNGAPLETPEVQAAKQQHFAAHAEANARSGHYAFAAPYQAYGLSALSPNALPLDTPEVAAAKLQHYSDYAVAAQRNGVHVAHAAAPLYAHPIADTPEVQLAKAAHFAAHAAARSGLHYRKRRALHYFGQAQHLPVIGPNGVPVETPEVQAAKADHFAAHASARSGLYAVGPATFGYGGAVAPLETPEVQAAKAHHFAAHAEALTRAGPSYGGIGYAAPYAYYPQAVIGHDGQPVETPEVQQAKAAHFAAHAAVHNHYY